MLKNWTNAAKLCNKEADKCRRPLTSEATDRHTCTKAQWPALVQDFRHNKTQYSHMSAQIKGFSFYILTICNKAVKWRQVKNMQSAPKGQWRGHKTVINQRKKWELDQCVDKARIQRTKVNNLYLKRVIFFTLWSSEIMSRKGFKRRLRHQMCFQKRLGATQSLNGVKAGGGKLFDWSNCKRTRIKVETKEIWVQKSCKWIPLWTAARYFSKIYHLFFLSDPSFCLR